MVSAARSEPDLERLLAHTPAMVWACGTDGGCSFVNQHGLDFIGSSLDAALGAGWADHAHPEDRPRVNAQYMEAFEARRPFELEYRLRRHDGEYRNMVARGVPTYDEQGEFSGYVGSSTDVTDMRDAERRVQRGLELFQSALDGLCCHIAVLDREGRIRLVNEAWRRFAEECALPLPDAGVGTSYLEICDRSRGEDAEEAAEVAGGIRDVLAGRHRSFQIEYPCHGLDQERWFLLRVAPLDGSGEAAVVVEHTNVTALRLAERERSLYEKRVRESQRLESLGVLAGGIAHDFNNLLTVILGNSRLAFDDLATDSPVRARLARVRAAAEQAARLTEQMLTYAGKGSLALEPVNLTHIVHDMRPLLDSCTEGRAILEQRLDEDVPAVEADAGQIRQLVLNLVINAVESMASDPGGVSIRTGTARVDAAELAESFGSPDLAPGDYVVLEVADAGPGIDPEQRQRLFEPFFSTKAEGRGLGLAVVLGIVRGHRGAIQVSSAPAAGTRFRVLLPPSSRAAREPADAPERQGDRRAVLVVDDDDGVREVAEAYLERGGFDVVCASSGRKALELVGARPDAFAAVVLDLAMPELNGSSTAAALKRIRPGLPILLVSGFSQEQAEERFPELDSAGLLRKPYEPEVLLERLGALLGRVS